MIIHLIAGLITSVDYKRFDRDISVKFDLSNYATKTDLKNVSHVDVSSFALKSNLASLKTELDKIDADKLKTVPVDLAKLSNVVKNDVIKKTEYDKLVAKVNGIDNTNFVSRTKYEKDGSDFEDKIDKIDKKIIDVTNLVKKTDLNTKVTEREGKIPDISGLATKSVLTVVENKIPDISSLATKSALTVVENKTPDVNNLVKKIDFTTKVTEIEGKMPNASNLVKKTDFNTRLKKISDRVTKNKAKHLLVENELKKLQKFDSAYFRGKSHFEEDGTQNYLVFQPIHRYFKRISNSDYTYPWKSKGLSDGTIDSITTSNNKITRELNFYDSKTRVEFSGSCLKQDKITYSHGTIVNIYIVYEISKHYSLIIYPTLENCLFGAVTLTKNADIDKYKYSGYGIGFDRHGEFSFGNTGFGRNCIIFRADLSSSSHANNKKNNILVLGKDFIQGINNTTIYTEKMYSINFTENNKKFLFKLAL